MKKVFILIAIISLSAVAASAQTTARRGNPKQSRAEVQRNFARNGNVRKADPRVLRLGPSTTYLREGLSIDDVVRVLGKPLSISERQDGNLRLATYTFPRSEGRGLRAEFEDGVLVRSRTGILEVIAQTSDK